MAYLTEYEELKSLRLEVERLQPLAEFGEKVFAELREAIAEGGFDMDAKGIADLAVETWLMEYIPYDPEKHNFDGCEEVEPGDMIYWWGGNDG